MSGPSVSELLDWFDRCEGLPTIRAAIGAVLRRESSPEQEARHAALTEALAAVEGVPVHSVWNYKDPALDVLDRSAVIDALTRLREGS